MMKDWHKKFLEALQQTSKSSTRNLDDLLDALRRSAPSLAVGIQSRKRVKEALLELGAAGFVRLPQGSDLWENSVGESLPIKIWLLWPKNSGEKMRVESSWAPALAFLSGISLPESVFINARAIETFFLGSQEEMQIVPIKERSLEIFGDEKKLERVLKGSLFGPGKLDLERDLRCRIVKSPLLGEIGPSSPIKRSVLVIENFSTYHSFCEWNKVSGEYQGIFYGAGQAFLGADISVFADDNQNPGWNGMIEYFGDLDGEGLRIPLEASKTFDFPVVPAVRWYRHLIARHEIGRLHIVMSHPGRCSENELGWLSDTSLIEKVQKLFNDGMRLPQEAIGINFLSRSIGAPESGESS